MNTTTKIILLLLSSVLICACSQRPYFSQYHPLPDTGWHQDSARVYTVDIQDTVGSYDLILHLRHTDRFPYQNMWLFIDRQITDTLAGLDMTLPSDTLEFYLADDRGVWLGNGRNAIYDMPVLYEENIRFPQAGQYTYTIYQGMRTTQLIGVKDIGLEVIRRQTN